MRHPLIALRRWLFDNRIADGMSRAGGVHWPLKRPDRRDGVELFGSLWCTFRFPLVTFGHLFVPFQSTYKWPKA
jgi:hypothetical protein